SSSLRWASTQAWGLLPPQNNTDFQSSQRSLIVPV
ncbi:uncharacterized, partial [Tachysurus ichikawai]